MTLNEFLKYVETRKPLKGDEIHQFMNKMSDEARRMTFELNGSYHAPEEIRELLSRLFNKPVDPSFRVFPPFYTDFGKNITVGKNVFINACCHFQDHGGVTLGDGCQIGHNVVFATLNHGFAPRGPEHYLPCPDRSEEECLGRLERNDPIRRNHWRERYSRSRLGSY
jgi:hypothetical protein